jgi:flagellar basal-body rod protein FlgF
LKAKRVRLAQDLLDACKLAGICIPDEEPLRCSIRSLLPLAHLVLGPSRMNFSLYQAAAALDGNLRWQQMVAENLAAGSTPGFKKQDISFSSVQAGVMAHGNPSLLPRPSFGINLQPGSLRRTGSNSDVCIEGPGFLSVQLPNGRTGFTRDGEFHVDAAGQLLNKDNFPLLSEGGTPIQLSPLNRESITIAEGGEISQNGVLVGKLALNEFQDPKQLIRFGSGYYVAPPTIAPGPPASSKVAQGYLESSNAVPTSEMSSLMLALRHFEANQKVIQMNDERMGRAIQELSATS